jgi:hypothetical protein
MKNNLNEEISRIKKLLNINENTLILEANPILNLIRKLAPSLEGKFISSVEAKLGGKKIAAASEAEIKAAFKSAELAAIRNEIGDAIYTAEKSAIDAIFAKYNMSAAGESARAYSELSALNAGEFAGITKELGRSYRAAKGSTGAGAGAGAGGKQAVTFGGKGLANLPLKSSVDEVMKHIDVDPVFSAIMKAKKGSRELVENWIEVNLGDNVTPKEILSKVEVYFDRIATSPDAKTVTFSKRIDQVIGLAKKGDEAWEGSKGAVKWGLTIGLIGVVVGAWTLKEFGGTLLCRLGWEKTNDWFGCTSGGGNTNNSGGKGRFN